MSKNKIIRFKKPEGPRLTPERKIFLLAGWFFDKKIEADLFRDENEMRLCWEANRKVLMSACEVPMEKRDFGLTYQNLRPWSFFKFDRGLPEIGYKGSGRFFQDINHEYQYLKDHGLTIPSDESRLREYNEIMNFRMRGGR